MSGIKLDKFGGQLPAWEPSLIPNGQAAIAVDCDVLNGALSGWRKPTLLRSLTNPNAAMVYRVPTISETKAEANLVFVANVSQGDTVKVGQQVYTFTATVAEPYDVLLGATAAESASNLFSALTQIAADQGIKYGTGTVINPYIDDEGLNILDTVTINSVSYNRIGLIAQDVGAAYNSTVLLESTSNARVTWIYPVLSLSNVVSTFLGGTNPSFDPDITGTGVWLEFEDPDTKVMRSPVVNDQFERVYISSPSLPPRYNTYDRIQAGSEPWLLGIPAPGCNPVVTVDGGGDDVTLGKPTTNSGANYVLAANTIFLMKITTDGAMQLDDVSFMPGRTTESGNFAAVLYDDENGSPGDILNVTGIFQGATAGTAVVLPFTNPSGLLSGRSYWFGFFSDEVMNLVYADSGNSGATIIATFSNGPPSQGSENALGLSDMQMWANLTSDAIFDARAYTYTWVSEYGEESPPSPYSLVNGWSNGVWSIGLYTPPTDDMGVTRNITKTRIYRTIASNSGLATYFLVAELPIGTESYVDSIKDDVVSLNSQLESQAWFEPPEGLQNVIALPNGMAAGFRRNEVWFSEPYRPHAWPPGYVLTTEFPIVGLGVTGQSLVICTAGVPYVATGVNPGSMALTRSPIIEPCISGGSIVSMEKGVLYASPNGLIRVTETAEVFNTTDDWVSRPKWSEFTVPKYIRAILLQSQYFAFGTVFNGDTEYAQTGFTVELSGADQTSFTIWPHPGGHRVGLGQLEAPNDYDVYNVQIDPWSGQAMLVQNGQVYYYDFTNDEPEITPYLWRSKLFMSKSRESFAAIKVYFDIPATTPTQAADRKEDPTDDASWATLDADRYGYIRVYADGVLVTVREIRTNGEILRILSGFKGEHWQFEIEARVMVTEVQIATSSKQLRLL